MEEEQIDMKKRLAIIESERTRLKTQISEEGIERLAKAAENRKIRDAKIKEVADVLLKIQKEIFVYNKSGVKLKGQNDILETIANLVEDPNAKKVATEQVEESKVEEFMTNITSPY